MNKSAVTTFVHTWIEKERKIWVKAHSNYPNPNQDAFLQGKVIDIAANQISVLLLDSHKEFKVPITNVLKHTYGQNDVADMVDLEELNQPQLLYNIKRRYLNDNIFTYCGPTLLIINPYTKIQSLFNNTVMNEFQTLVFTQNLQYKHLIPHIFGLAAFTLWQLFDNQRNQSIVISGQSGAGKTENTKYCLRFLASLGKSMKDLVVDKSMKINYQQMRNVEKAIKKANAKINGIQDRILGCNQILEAFGNAKTIRNDNSSRFGKLILLLYGETHIDIKSAFILSYLLEKSRLVSIADGQRNYHVFYYLCAGLTPQEREKYQLRQPAKNYFYLNQSSTYDIPGQDPAVRFQDLKKQFEQYLENYQIQCVFKILSAILNMGNLKFKKTQTADNEETGIPINQQYLKTVCSTLEVDLNDFQNSLLIKKRKVGLNYINSPYKYDEILALRDSFTKNIYQKLFNFLISKLNEKIELEKIDLDNQSKQQRIKRKSIGLLDIFGFQVLGINTLEQFFINFANEKLQQLYVSYIFKEEQNEFIREGLKEFSHQISFQDNQPLIDLFENYPLGIFHLINQSSELNKADEDLPLTINKNHPKNPFFTVPLSKRSHFQINHSCSSVMYNSGSFTAKNKDQFPQQLLKIFQQTKLKGLKDIVIGPQQTVLTTTKGGRGTKKFLGLKFLNDMNKLTDQLYSSDCHFVRCIKPNSVKSPKLFTSELVLQSLRYLGVLDSIIIRKLGYIYRRPFKQFYKKFFQLQQYIFNYMQSIKNKTQEDFKEQCRKMMEKYAQKELADKDILFGHKKILIKENALNHLELLLKEKKRLRINVANRVKQMCKKAKFRTQVHIFNKRIATMKYYLILKAKMIRQQILRHKICRIQHNVRKFLWKKRLEKIEKQATKSVTKIAAQFRMRVQRQKFLKIKAKVIKLQSQCRAFLQAGKFIREKSCRKTVLQIYDLVWQKIENIKAIVIQRHYKGFKTRTKFKAEIRQIKKVIALKRIRLRFQRALFRWRYNKFREALMRYKKPILMLQSIVKRRYCQRVYKQLKESTILIQKAYRLHLNKKFYLERLWKNYKKQLIQTEKNKFIEVSSLGVCHVTSKNQKNIQQTISINSKLYPNQIFARYLQKKPEIQKLKQYSLSKSVNDTSHIFSEKNTIRTYIGDFDIISDLNYSGSWMYKYACACDQLNKKNDYPVNINICDGFTAIISCREKLYCFQAANQQDVQDSGLLTKFDIEGIPKILETAQQSGYIVTMEQKMYVWGDNKDNELFFKGDSYKLFGENKYTKRVINIAGKGDRRYFIKNDGHVFQKITQFDNQQHINKLQSQKRFLKIAEISSKVGILQIAVSYNFTIFLGTNGLVYSQGANNFGQLGLGSASKFPINTIEQIPYFKNQKEIIQTISVGISHTVAKSKLGYAYSWGYNAFGQVRNNNQPFFDTPQIVDLDKYKGCKVFQAVAGLRTTYLLIDSLKVIAFGSSSSFQSQASVWQYNVNLISDKTTNGKNLIPIKIYTSWSRTMSILGINCIDTTKCKPAAKPDVIIKHCKTLAKDWTYKNIYPAYHEWMDNILNLSDMRKFKFSYSSSIGNKGIKKSPLDPDNELQQLKILMQLRKTSTLFKKAAKKKIEQISKRLSKKPPNQWTNLDKELDVYIKENFSIAMK